MYNRIADQSISPPCMFFDRADIPYLRKKLEHPDCRETWQRLLRACEQRLDPEPGDLIKWHIRAEHMAFAWLMTGRREFAEKARAMALEKTALPFWSGKDPAANPLYRADLGTGGSLRIVCFTYDWLSDFLGEDDRRAIREAVRAKAFEPWLADIRDNKPHIAWYTCNGINVLNGPMLAAAVLFENDYDTSAYFDAALRQIRNAIAAHCPDGGYPEGPLYWNYGIRYMLYGVEPLRRLKGIDLYQEPFLHNTGDYILHQVLPWLTNCHNPSDSSHFTHLWEPVAAFAAYHKRPEWQWLARRLIKHGWNDDGEGLEYSLMYLIYYQPELPAAPPPQEKAIQLFSGLQNLEMRSDWSEDAIACLWLSGATNFHHNHLHLNSFDIAAYGERLLIDMGQYDYAMEWEKDYRSQTAGHNSLLVNGKGQIITTDTDIFCRHLRAGQWGTVYGIFNCLREEAGAVIATGSVINAYPGLLDSFDRTLAFIGRRFFFLHDFVKPAVAPPVALEWHFHSADTAELTTDGALFASGNARLAISLLEPAAVTRRIETAPAARCVPGKPVMRFDILASCSAPAFEIFMILAPFRDGRPPTRSLSRAGNEIRIEFENHALHYDPLRRKLRRWGQNSAE